MDETVDVQGTAIGLGGLLALGALLYGSFVSETVFGLEATTAATWVFAATFLAVALLHGAYGRRDLGVAHGGAALGLVLVLQDTPLLMVFGLVVLVAAGSYIAVATLRARDADAPARAD
ncbi:hypothetical protein [Natrononativus amylolyticus]|uniref:hypothetical protein n=1 Tax=Natrononativus amylolyticus TaxID=2963434 RepID=UPI0020CF0D24|nr:hypothetical protein [Natrononativus amylolyticus]